MPLDRAKLVKALQMTTSKNDHEALAAIRMANRMLEEAKVGWGGLISGSRAAAIVGAETPAYWMRPAPTMSIDEALEYLVANDGDDWIPLRREWERRRQMSPYDQRRMMDRVYDLRRQQT
jgi:hypothetical protein